MLAENLVEEFEMKEDEPWYDHQDLQQGEGGGAPRAGGRRRRRPGPGGPRCETVKKLLFLAAEDAGAGKGSGSPGGGAGRARGSRPQEASARGPRPC